MRRGGNAILARVSRTRFRERWAPTQQDGHQVDLEARRMHVEDSFQPPETTENGFDVPSLDGKFAAVKDNFNTSSMPTTCASNMLQDFHAPRATVNSLLDKAGVYVIAKTNMDEFGMGTHSTNSAYGPVVNNPASAGRYSAGGSSGGSAIAVASGEVDFALGSDTGGSVRLPAAYTQTIGFKPSYGRISRNGLIPYANSLDTVGIIAKSCKEIMGVFGILDKHDSRDPTCLSVHSRARIAKAARRRAITKARLTGVSNFTVMTPLNLKQYRIGVPMEYNIEEIHPVVRKAWMQFIAQLRAHGHEIVPISLPTTMHALSAYYILAPAEASSNLAKYDGVRYGAPRKEGTTDDENGTLYAHHRGALFGDEVKRRILLGSYTLSAGAIDNYFIKAQKVRRLIQHDFNLVFRMPHPLLPHTKPYENGVDYIVCPTAPTPPPLLKEVKNADPLESHINDIFTVPASLAGLPAISVPPPKAMGEGSDLERLPGPSGIDRAVGIQIIGQFGDDQELLTFVDRELRNFKMPKSNSGGRKRLI